jgi:hypothetical protein
MCGDPPEASLPELANYPLEASRTRIPRLLAATNTQGSPRIIGGQIASPVTLKATFDQDTALAPIGGAEYLAKLAGAGAPLTRLAESGMPSFSVACNRRVSRSRIIARLVYDH